MSSSTVADILSGHLARLEKNIENGEFWIADLQKQIEEHRKAVRTAKESAAEIRLHLNTYPRSST